MSRPTLLLAPLLWCVLAFAPTTPAPAQDLVQVQFPNADVNAVLDYYAMLTGKRLVRANSVTGQTNIVINDRVPKEEAIKIIEINLLMNGYVLVPAGGNIVKVLGQNAPPRSAGIPMFSQEDQLPDGEQIVTFLAKLNFSDPVELANTLTQAIPPNPVLGGPSITPLPKSQALLITENTAVIRGLLRIIREVDLPPAEVKSIFVTLLRADAEEVLQQLEKIFQTTPSPGGGPGGGAPRTVPAPRPQAMSPEGNPLPAARVDAIAPGTIEINAGTTLSEDSIIVGKIRLTADKRTNRIHVVARERNLDFIRGLLKEFDAVVEFGEPITRPLKFVSAGDILDAIVQAISDPGAKDQQVPGGAQQQQQPRPGQAGGRAGPAFGDTGRQSNDGFGGSSTGTGGFSESLSTEEPAVIPETRLIGNSKIIADKRANAIIVIGNQDVQEKIFRVIDELDVRAPQVMIHTVIGELTLTDNQSFGVDYILRSGNNGRGLGTVTPGTGTGTGTNSLVVNPAGFINSPGLNLTNLLTQTAITQIGTAGAGGLSGFFTAGDALDAIVVALEATNRFRVTQRPKIFTSNNKRAVIASGEEIAIPTNIQRGFGGDNLQTSSSIQFKTIAVKLEVLPLINSAGEVTLDIVQSVDQRSGASTIIDGNAIPTIATRALKTNISVPSGATIALGGLIRQDNNRSKSGIPYLSRIPLIGPLFGNTSKDRSRTELIILLRPVVTVGPREPVQLREREQEFMNLEPDLEATIMPPNVRERVPNERPFRRGDLHLREKTETPGFRK